MKKKTPVLVTTEHKGVFFGYLDSPHDEKIVTLTQARMCVYWSADVKGVLGLAATGPSNACKIGPPVPSLILHGVTSIAHVTQDAVEKWEGAPWCK